MAPEVAKGEAYNAYSADIYSLGVTLYIMLTAEVPIQNELDNELSTADCYNECNSG